MSRFLLDVNAVLALLDAQHGDHQTAREWAVRTRGARWLTCPIVQNGVVRIASQPAYSRSLGGVAAVREALQAFGAQRRHEFVPDDISVLDDAHVVRPDLLTPKNLTDVYLLLSPAATAYGSRRSTVGWPSMRSTVALPLSK